jgi:hypothetical protein
MHPRCQVRSSCRQGWCRVFMHTPKPFKGQAMGSCMLSSTVVEHLWTGTWRVHAPRPLGTACMHVYAMRTCTRICTLGNACMDGRYPNFSCCMPLCLAARRAAARPHPSREPQGKAIRAAG